MCRLCVLETSVMAACGNRRRPDGIRRIGSDTYQPAINACIIGSDRAPERIPTPFRAMLLT